MKELIARGTPVDALDGRGRTALQLAIKACVDSFWAEWRKPDSVKALLDAGAWLDGVEIPTGYDEVDTLFGGSRQLGHPQVRERPCARRRCGYAGGRPCR